jgi:hypothetical protein
MYLRTCKEQKRMSPQIRKVPHLRKVRSSSEISELNLLHKVHLSNIILVSKDFDLSVLKYPYQEMDSKQSKTNLLNLFLCSFGSKVCK